MGYLNGNTITVDAILTKHGRQKLAEGQSLGITKFALSDDGVDYTLYNPDHALGSSYYGEAITDLPQLEAVPDDTNLMKYTLMTMDRNTIFLPKITSINETYTLENQNSKQKISPNTENSSDSSYHFVFNNISGLNITGGTQKRIGGTSRTFLSRADIPTGGIWSGRELTVTAAPTDETKEYMVQIIGAQSGAVKYINIVVNNNIRISPTV
tara:strand:+ start:546 stop:1178 length:633 start_codon:yes stop_codon:yes gene_type:complete